MTTLDTKLVPRVHDLITKYGKDVDFEVLTPGTHDPATGERTGDTATIFTDKVTPPGDDAHKYFPKDVISVGDVYIMVAAQGIAFTPVLGMKVTMDSEDWRINLVSRLYTGEDIAAYTLLLRK